MSQELSPVSLMEEHQKLEGGVLFECADCDELFEKVIEWALHAKSKHPEVLAPGYSILLKPEGGQA